MQLLNISIDRIIIHQIYQRDQDGNEVTPTQSHEYTNFDRSAMEVFKNRVIDALGENSKAIQMEIVSQDQGNLPKLVDQIIDQDNDSFAVSSYDIAKKLTGAQLKSTSGGIVVVFCGKQGHPLKKFLGIIKAEIHSGYEKEINEKNEISLKFIEEVLLTPGTRLYKTAAFFEKASIDDTSTDLNKKWTVMVSDHQNNKSSAAHFFFSKFLGCGHLQTNARTTKKFYESASSFIMKLDIPQEEKSDLFNALTTYLKVDTSSTISSSDFASKYFDLDTQDVFVEYMEESGLPTTSFSKDTSDIKKELTFRKVSFSKNVKISAPSEIFKNLVSIKSIEGDLDESGTPAEWTQVIIKDRITGQE